MKVTLCAATVVVLALLTAPLATGAPPVGKVWRIGVLAGGIATAESPRGASFRQGLRDLGYVEGQNLVLEWRPSGGQVSSPSGGRCSTTPRRESAALPMLDDRESSNTKLGFKRKKKVGQEAESRRRPCGVVPSGASRRSS